MIHVLAVVQWVVIWRTMASKVTTLYLEIWMVNRIFCTDCLLLSKIMICATFYLYFSSHWIVLDLFCHWKWKFNYIRVRYVITIFMLVVVSLTIVLPQITSSSSSDKENWKFISMFLWGISGLVLSLYIVQINFGWDYWAIIIIWSWPHLTCIIVCFLL